MTINPDHRTQKYILGKTVKFGQRLKHSRRQKELTQTQLAKAVGVSQQFIWKLESGLVERPSKQLVAKLSKVLKVAPGWLAYERADLMDLPDDDLDMLILIVNLDPEDKKTIYELVSSLSRKRI